MLVEPNVPDRIETIGILIAIILASCLALVAAGHAIVYKRDPKGAALWVILCLLVPFAGPWFYWVFGINRLERRAAKILRRRPQPFDLRKTDDEDHLTTAETQTVGELGRLLVVADHVTRLPLVSGNDIAPLSNGEQAYPAMLEAIRTAERSVTLASYIFDWDDVGRTFCADLAEAAGRGVQVRVLLDGVGAVLSWSRIGRSLIKSGAKVAAFFPLRFPFGRLRINLRNHRKILVVDGKIGFTGGMNISSRHLVENDNPGRCEDLQFRVTGPVVGEMQHIFAEDWLFATNEQLEGEDFFPALRACGTAVCRGIASGPDEDFEKIHWILLAAFAAARHSVYIATPYFIPTMDLMSAMILAAMRGVKITLVLPQIVDHRFMRWAADAYLWQLLQHGIRIFRRPAPFAHTKLLMVDETWVLLGSANLDPRSFRLNFEFNIEVYDGRLAKYVCDRLERETSRLTPVTLEEMDRRGLLRKLRDGAMKLFSPHL
ncbi:MAG: cardiolipin synthase [Planctomycetota bacterium]